MRCERKALLAAHGLGDGERLIVVATRLTQPVTLGNQYPDLAAGRTAIFGITERRTDKLGHLHDVVGLAVAVEIGGFGEPVLAGDMQLVARLAAFLARLVEIGANLGR